MLNGNRIARGIIAALLTLILVYVGIGLAFHARWARAQAACRAERTARGEVVEPEVFGGALGLAFDVIGWPMYLRANLRHFGDPFSTPCSRGEADAPDMASLEAGHQALDELGLGWEEHGLAGPPSLMPLTFEPVEGTQAEILARYERQRAVRPPVPVSETSMTSGPSMVAEPYTATTQMVESETGQAVIAQVEARREGNVVDCIVTSETVRDGLALNEAQG